eukprot:GILJ01010348.1.p1 GENE.GILJ01010348.1~~GILJ01010348.1.p1  ORF type:complete len:1245 (-),score=263.74 GILJ01010348.1:619-4080(-)
MMDFNLDYYCHYDGKKILDESYWERNTDPNTYSIEARNISDPTKDPFDLYYPHTFFHSFSSNRAVIVSLLPVPVATQYTAQKTLEIDVPTSGGVSTVSVTLNHSAYMIVSVKPYATDGQVKDFAKDLAEVTIAKVLEIHGLTDIIEASVISAPNFYDLIGTAVANDITRTLWVILPLTVIFFGTAIGSVRLAIVPVVSFIVSVLASMAITYGIAFNGAMDVNSLATGVILVFTMALTMDYNFFLLSQFKRAVNDQIRDTLQEASENGKRLFGKGAVSFRQILIDRRLRLGPKDALGVPTRIASPESTTNVNVNSAEPTSDTPAEFGGFEKEEFEAMNNGTYEPLFPLEFDQVEIMKRVYSSAGRTICTTTAIILLSSIAMFSYSLDQIQSLGVTIFTTTLINFLTCIILTPTMLLLWHYFFFIGAAERVTSAISPATVTTPSYQLSDKEIAKKASRKQKVQGLIGVGDAVDPAAESNNTIAALEGSRATTMDSTSTEPSRDDSSSTVPVESDTDSDAEDKSQDSINGHPRWTWWCITGKKSSEMLLPEKKRRTDFRKVEDIRRNNNDAILDVYIRHAQTPVKVSEKLNSNFIFVYRLLAAFPQSILSWLFGVGVLFAFFGYAVGSDAFLYSNNLKQYMPVTNPVVRGWDSFMEDYLPGSLFTYQLLMEYPSINNFTDAAFGYDFFAQQQFMAQVMIERLPSMTPKAIEAVAFSGVLSDSILASTGGNISYTDVGLCAYYSVYVPFLYDSKCIYLLLLASMFTSADSAAPGVTYFSIPLPFDPTDQDPGEEWYNTFVNELIPYFRKTVPFVKVGMVHRDEAEAARDLYFAENGISDESQLPSYFQVNFYLRGGPGQDFETIRYAKESLAVVCGITIAIIFSVILVVFGSLVTALRITFNVTLVVASCYCMTILTYASQGLDRMRISAFQGPGASLLWMVPFIILLCSVAVALNYELITTAKAFELRWGLSTNALRPKKVLTTQAAIERAHSTTAREVFASGFMMMFMFVGIGLLSDVSAMNQIGFLMVVVAFFSAFFGRTFITPSLMHMLGEYNWFPLNCLPAHLSMALPVVNATPADLLCETRKDSTGKKVIKQKETPPVVDETHQQQYPNQFDFAEKDDIIVDDHTAEGNHNDDATPATKDDQTTFEMAEQQ